MGHASFRRHSSLLLATVCWLYLPEVCSADLVSAGDIAFIGVNFDGNDDFAIVLLADASVGNVVHFNDNEWTGSMINGTGEGEITWTASAALAAGTVVTFSNLRTTPTAMSGATNVGAITGGTMSLSADEAIYAFTGANAMTPTTFLAAFSNNEEIYDDSVTIDGTLAGTGLTQGTTAVLVAANGGDFANGAQYTGVRSGEAAFSDYLSLIGNTAGNWGVDYASGTGFVPFNSTQFTLSPGNAVPEPGSLALMALLIPLCLTPTGSRKSGLTANVRKSCQARG